MMTEKEVYERFERLHSYSFSTMDREYPEIRIAHFLTYDDEGLYFQTMKVKPFYAQLKRNGKVAACAQVAGEGAAVHDEDGLSYFPAGYYIRVSGEVRELTNEELTRKAEQDARFSPLVKDIERYPTMTTFVLHRFKGEVYDFDFEKEHRDHKLERERFSFGGMEHIEPGFTIDPEACIACGICAEVCTFGAIIPGEKYTIDGSRCDECGSCYSVCPKSAVNVKSPMDEAARKECGKSILEFSRSQR